MLQEQGRRLVCGQCGAHWVVKNDVPCFLKDAPYWGELPRDEMRALLKSAQKGYWRDALEMIPDAKREQIIAHGSDEARGWWRYLLPGTITGKVLDIGAGLGAITFSLANAGYDVVAVDSVIERATFLKIRRDQDEVNNVQTACASALELPFPASSFDLVIMNGVFEWLGLSDTSLSPKKVQKKVLQKVFNLLKPGGILYLAIENRIAAIYILGFKDPHSGLRFTTLMPRKIADWYARMKQKGGYKTYIYSKFGYAKMLKEAGFKKMRFFLPLPSYRNFKVIVPIGNRKVTKYCATHIWNMKQLRLLKSVSPLVKILPLSFLIDYFAPDYSIIARK
jgi:SAM-dependent methyltransferase